LHEPLETLKGAGMTNRFAIAVVVSWALALGACGRDDKQEKVGGSAASPSSANPSSANPSSANPSSAGPSSANPSSANPSSSAADKSVGTTREPLQTGEFAKDGPGLPDGTKTGARTTPNPK
jgi:hypothetical protein